MKKSIINNEKRCYICGNNNWLETHHIFEGRNRKNSEEDGLKINLCHYCHNEPPNGLHFNKNNNLKIKKLAQEKWMEHYNKTEDDFIKRYGRSYLWMK